MVMAHIGTRTGREKEHHEQIGWIWIYEIAELASRYIDVEQVKHFLSRTHDAARGAYAHGRVDIDDDPPEAVRRSASEYLQSVYRDPTQSD
jgi:predicted P-loop ATPase